MTDIKELSGGSFHLEMLGGGTRIRLTTNYGAFDIMSDTAGAEAPLVIEEVSPEKEPLPTPLPIID